MRHPRSANGFTLLELIVVMAIIGVLVTIMTASFGSAQARSRDARRKSDLEQIGKALELYYNDHQVYPDDSAGQILGCGTAAAITACTWGLPFQQRATGATSDTVYMVQMPKDPRDPSLHYFYEAAANFKSFQLYARLENSDDRDVPKDGSDQPQVYSTLNCGNNECNYGISSSNTTPATGRTLVTE